MATTQIRAMQKSILLSLSRMKEEWSFGTKMAAHKNGLVLNVRKNGWWNKYSVKVSLPSPLKVEKPVQGQANLAYMDFKGSFAKKVYKTITKHNKKLSKIRKQIEYYEEIQLDEKLAKVLKEGLGL